MLDVKLAINKVLYAAIAIAVLAVSIVLFITIRQTSKLRDTAQAISHTQEVIINIQNAVLSVDQNEGEVRRFLITGSEQFLETLKQSDQDTKNYLVKVKMLTSDNFLQQNLSDSLSLYVNKSIDFSKNLITLHHAGKPAEASNLVLMGEGKLYSDKIRDIGTRMQNEEYRLLEIRKRSNNRSFTQLNLILYSILLASLVLSVIAILRIGKNINKQKLNEEKFRSLLDAAPDATVIVNGKGIIQMINQQTENLFGYSRDELIGESVEILVPGELRNDHVKHRANFFSSPKVRTMGAGIELNALKKDGAKIPVEISLSPIRTKEDLLVSASIRDITQRKEAEEKLKAIEEQYRLMIDEVEDYAIILLDNDGVIKNWNRGAEKIKGYEAKEIIGKNFRLFYTKEDQQLNLPAKIIEEARQKGKASVEGWRVRKDGTTFWGTVIIAALHDEKGKVIGFTKVTRDITDRKKAEEKFRSLLDAAPDATVIVNEKGIIQMINQQTENLFGYSRDELIGKPVEILIPGELRNDHVQHRGSFFKSPKVRTMGAGIELKALKKDATKFPVEISLSPLQTEEGLLVSASVRDISFRISLENELKKSNAEMEAFTYSVSHDLRAPLRGIIGFAAILEDEYGNKLDYEAKRITSVIKNNTLKMGHLVDDLLAFSRMGKQELIKKDINTMSLINEIVNELIQLENKKKINWDLHPLPRIKADENTVRQVWINLVSNAVKYSSTKENPTIEIGSYEQEGFAVFYVKDNGVGFDEEYKHKLFKVFQRLHDAEEFEGTGVGLAIVEKIISRHGGNVWAEGKEDEGACFYFSLPL